MNKTVFDANDISLITPVSKVEMPGANEYDRLMIWSKLPWGAKPEIYSAADAAERAKMDAKADLASRVQYWIHKESHINVCDAMSGIAMYRPDVFDACLRAIVGQSRSQYTPHDSLYVEWSGAGASGGSCWGGIAEDYDAEEEPEFTDLWAAIGMMVPFVPARLYGQVQEQLDFTERTRYDNDYYGNYSSTKIKSISYLELYFCLEPLILKYQK